MRRLLANGWIVTMDDAGTEHESGWVLVDGSVVSAVGDGRAAGGGRGGRSRAARSSRRVSSTPITISSRRSRGRGRRRPISSPGCASSIPSGRGSTTRPSTRRRGPAWPSWRCRGCTTVFDHHYLFPRGTSGLVEAEVRAAREIGVRIVASRGSMDLGESAGGLPPDSVVEDADAVLAATEELAGRCTSRGAGAMVQIAVAPCSPFSVTKQLMADSAALARRLGLQLHTHLAETVEEDAYCRELYGCTPVEYLAELGWTASDVWCAHCVHLSPADVADLRERRRRRRPLPHVQPAAGGGRRARTRAGRRGRAGGAGRGRLGVERALRSLLRGQAGAARRARPRRAGGDDVPRGAAARHAGRRGRARAGRHRLDRGGQVRRSGGVAHRRPRAGRRRGSRGRARAVGAAPRRPAARRRRGRRPRRPSRQGRRGRHRPRAPPPRRSLHAT